VVVLVLVGGRLVLGRRSGTPVLQD
jgi:hypothetical protein